MESDESYVSPFSRKMPELWRGGGDRLGVLPIVVGYVLINGVRRSSGVPTVAAASMLVMLLGCWTVYVVTPYDFAWHVRTSVERIVLHLFPTLVWSTLITAAGQDDGSGTRNGSVTLGSFRVRIKPDATDHDL